MVRVAGCHSMGCRRAARLCWAARTEPANLDLKAKLWKAYLSSLDRPLASLSTNALRRFQNRGFSDRPTSFLPPVALAKHSAISCSKSLVSLFASACVLTPIASHSLFSGVQGPNSRSSWRKRASTSCLKILYRLLRMESLRTPPLKRYSSRCHNVSQGSKEPAKRDKAGCVLTTCSSGSRRG